MFTRKRKVQIRKLSNKTSKLRNTHRQKYKTAKEFRRPSSPLLRKTQRFLFFATIVAIIIGGIYITFFSNFFSIDEIKVINENPINEDTKDTIKKQLQKIKGENLIFFEIEDLSINIKRIFPEIEQITITKDYPHTIKVEFQEYPLVANLVNISSHLKKNYIVNSIGEIIKEDLENPNLPYIMIKSEDTLNPENEIIEADKLRYILESIIYFEDKFGMRIIETEYKKIPREVHLLTERNFEIWLDIQKPAEDQLKKLKKSLVKLDIYNINLEYIDLRIAGNNGDKIIYK